MIFHHFSSFFPLHVDIHRVEPTPKSTQVDSKHSAIDRSRRVDAIYTQFFKNRISSRGERGLQSYLGSTCTHFCRGGSTKGNPHSSPYLIKSLDFSDFHLTSTGWISATTEPFSKNVTVFNIYIARAFDCAAARLHPKD